MILRLSFGPRSTGLANGFPGARLYQSAYVAIAICRAYLSFLLPPTPVPLLCTETDASVKVQLAAKTFVAERAKMPALSRPLNTLIVIEMVENTTGNETVALINSS